MSLTRAWRGARDRDIGDIAALRDGDTGDIAALLCDKRDRDIAALSHGGMWDKAVRDVTS